MSKARVLNCATTPRLIRLLHSFWMVRVYAIAMWTRLARTPLLCCQPSFSSVPLLRRITLPFPVIWDFVRRSPYCNASSIGHVSRQMLVDLFSRAMCVRCPSVEVRIHALVLYIRSSMKENSTLALAISAAPPGSDLVTVEDTPESVALFSCSNKLFNL